MGADVPKRDAPLRVDVPDADTIRYGRVGAFAAVGLVVGLLWPKLAGFSLVPGVPVEERGDEIEAEEPTPKKKKPEPAAAAVAPKGPAEDEAPAATDRLSVSELIVVSCVNAQGQKLRQCGSLELDGWAKPKLLNLANCEAAESETGVLSLGLELDFEKNSVVDFLKGKSTTLDSKTTNALFACAKKEFATASLKDLEHEHSRYTVFYKVELLPPGSKAPDEEKKEDGDGVTPASGTATVGWEVALIRSAPKDGDIVARLLNGTRVVVSGRKGDWYRVKYDSEGNEGWVFKTAIGL